MATNITLKTFKGGNVTPQDDAIICQGDESHQRAGGETLQGHKGTQADDKGHRLR